jgi:membrane protease YdiL (CAAX protease family)
VALGATALYLRTRRLLPLIIAHVIADMLSAATAVLIPALQQ